MTSAQSLVDEGPPQIFRDPVEQEAGEHTSEECCGNLNVVMFMHIPSQGQENNKILVFWEAFTVSRE